MGTNIWAHLCLCTLLAAALPGVSAAELPAQSASSQVAGLLQRIQVAARERSYQGTRVNSVGATLTSSRVAHYLAGGQAFESVELLDGEPHRVYRQDDQVLSLWPQRRLAVLEQRTLRQGLPSMLQSIDPRAEASYDIKAQGLERVAGREAHVLTFHPRDEHRFAQRIWADVATGLMLRAEVLGGRGEVLEASMFSDVSIGTRPSGQTVAQAMRQLEGYQVTRRSPQTTQLGAEGWAMSSVTLSGFRLADCARRMLDAEPGAKQGEQRPVLQAVFSDGLTHVSMFVEAYEPERHHKPLLTQIGATHTLMQRHAGQWWLTVVGDVPAATLQYFAKALERQR